VESSDSTQAGGVASPNGETPPRSSSAFGKDARLRSHWQLELMKSAGCKVVGKYCIIVVHQTPPDGQSRAAFLISRKFSLLAVERNRARRLFREVYRRLHDCIAPCWMVFIPRKRISNVKMQDILQETRQLAEKAGAVFLTEPTE